MEQLIKQLQEALRNSNLVHVARDTGLGRATLYRMLNEPEAVKVGTVITLTKHFNI